MKKSTPEDRARAEALRWDVEWFIASAEQGLAMDPDRLRRVAAAVKASIDSVAPMHVGRTRIRPEDAFPAWFGVECDPDYNTLPRSKAASRSQVGAYQAVAELLGMNESTVEKHAAAFEEYRTTSRGHVLPVSPKMLLAAGHLTAYANAKKMELPRDLSAFENWLDARLDPTGELSRRAYLRKK